MVKLSALTIDGVPPAGGGPPAGAWAGRARQGRGRLDLEVAA